MCKWIVPIIYVVLAINSANTRKISPLDAAILDNHVSIELLVITNAVSVNTAARCNDLEGNSCTFTFRQAHSLLAARLYQHC